MPIKSFRGLIKSGTQDIILLHTNDGSTGYRIVKFQTMPKDSTADYELTTKIYTVSQSTIDEDVDFSDQTLLGTSFIGIIGGAYAGQKTIIHDNMVFNQDIYLTSIDISGGAAQDTNYYIELEQIKLDLTENTVATLKDIRNIESQS